MILLGGQTDHSDPSIQKRPSEPASLGRFFAPPGRTTPQPGWFRRLFPGPPVGGDACVVVGRRFCVLQRQRGASPTVDQDAGLVCAPFLNPTFPLFTFRNTSRSHCCDLRTVTANRQPFPVSTRPDNRLVLSKIATVSAYFPLSPPAARNSLFLLDGLIYAHTPTGSLGCTNVPSRCRPGI